MRVALALSVVAIASAGGALAQDAAMPVAVGGRADVNACVSTAAAGSVEVRVGPGDRYEVYDTLAAGDAAFVCQRAGSWYGIVYGKGDCGVSQPIPEQRTYIGACRTGWVTTRSMAATNG